MSVLSFIKENRVLVAGITLPLLLVGLLAFTKTLPDKTVADPEYKLAYMTQNWSSRGVIKQEVSDKGNLYLSFKEHENQTKNRGELPKATIFIYDPSTEKISEFPIKLVEKDETVTLEDIPEFERMTFSDKTLSPDDYLFEPYHYRSNSMITEVFIGNHYDGRPALTKKGRIVRLPKATSDYYGNVEFIGWITKENQ